MLSRTLMKHKDKYINISRRINYSTMPNILYRNDFEIMEGLFEDKERTTSMQDLIEKIVTNGLGYRTQHIEDLAITDNVKNSEEGLQAHLAELETITNYNSNIKKIRDAYRNLLIVLSRQENKKENMFR